MDDPAAGCCTGMASDREATVANAAVARANAKLLNMIVYF
jgi:hypothetical protein